MLVGVGVAASDERSNRISSYGLHERPIRIPAGLPTPLDRPPLREHQRFSLPQQVRFFIRQIVFDHWPANDFHLWEFKVALTLSSRRGFQAGLQKSKQAKQVWLVQLH